MAEREAPQTEKREQAPALQMEFYTGLIIARGKESQGKLWECFNLYANIKSRPD